ncbi:Extracellular signal-regulated kinase 1, partial [Diplonema papillatum]
MIGAGSEFLTPWDFQSLHDPTDEPTCAEKFYWEKDSSNLTKYELRDGLWEEIQRYHPDKQRGSMRSWNDFR